MLCSIKKAFVGLEKHRAIQIWAVMLLGVLESVVVLQSGSLVVAADVEVPPPAEPEVSPASEEATEAMAAIRIPDGWKIGLWAAEPDVANVVAFDIDRVGRVYVCETFRQNRGVTDNRGHDKTWLYADLAAKTVQDRIDYHKRLLGDAAITYMQQDDRIRRLTDTDGDGKADESVLVANGFNRLEEGTGAGILATDEGLFYTCIPKLWKLVDQNGDGKIDERIALSDGYGVRVAFRGHDLHGLIRGYDGRIYFSIGDRGYHLRNKEGKVLADPASGAVFRCELDGSNLEVFARGLRNPQELAFNDRGDWFTVDNNSDSGDRARLVHLLQDGDTGWRMYYQYLPNRGPFNQEKIWYPLNEDQPAHVVPPVANFTDGPSGLAYYPGTGFGDRLDDTFLICDFRGGPSNSGVRTFQVEPAGATYTKGEDTELIWSTLATDVAFGPDGAIYVSDWVNGWDGLGKGRIFQVTDPTHQQDAAAVQAKQWLAQEFSELDEALLLERLAHVDQRVRLHSQWELARRNSLQPLASILADGKALPLARLHAVWGLGQIARSQQAEFKKNSDELIQAIVGAANDSDQDVAFAALSVAGEQAWGQAIAAATKALQSQSSRVRYAAIDALGRCKDAKSIKQVLQIAVAAPKDAALRHAAAMYLSRVLNSSRLAELKEDDRSHVRLLAVVALRRQQSGAVRAFLDDSDPKVVLEAARAIHDQPISAAMLDLAALIKRPAASKALSRRVLNANYRMGTPENAVAVAQFATRGEAGEDLRLEALEMLANWAAPDALDRVLGDYRPLEKRSQAAAATALEPQVDLLMASAEKVRLKAIDVASSLGIKKIGEQLAKQVLQKERSAAARAEALRGLARLNPSQAVAMAQSLTQSKQSAALTLASLDVLAQHAAAKSISRFIDALQDSNVTVRQRAWDLVSKDKSAKADEVIAAATADLIAGKLETSLHLNVLQAAEGRLKQADRNALADYQATLAKSEPLAKWIACLDGGDVQAGKKLFFEKTELSCVRCHKVDRTGGEVGPNLTTIGKDKDARYLLEALCLPDAQVAKGFETTNVVDIDGRVLAGIVRQENDDFIELMLPDGKLERVLQDDIEVRKKGKSAMPQDLIKHLSDRELRDLVAYLKSLKKSRRGASEAE